MKSASLLFLLLILASCGHSQTGREEEKIRQSALSFYQWYINGLNTGAYLVDVQVVEGEGGKAQLDIDGYLARLRALGTLSEKFLERERDRLLPCADFLKTVDWREYLMADVYEFDEPCSFLYFNYWANIQESVDGVEAEDLRLEGSRAATVTLAFYSNGEQGRIYWPELNAVIQLERENGEWKITDIEVSAG